MAQIIPLLIISIYIPLFTIFYQRLFLISPINSLLASLTTTPLFISLALYCLFAFIPNLPGLYYVLGLSSLALLLHFICRPRYNLPSLPKIKIDSSSKVILFFLAFSLLLCSLRIWFWPINWDDQIYYIEQAYTFGQDRSTLRFQEWGIFKNDQLQFQINPSIRPALPLIYSLASLVSTNLQDTVFFSQTVTFYYLNVFILIFIYFIYKVSPKQFLTKSIIGLFLVFTTYLFVNLTVLGFKEMLIICLLLLALIHYPNLIKKHQIKDYLYLGILYGLMSFINYSGSLLACIFVVHLFFQIKDTFPSKIRGFILFTIILFFISGLEFLYFFHTVTDNKFKKINIQQIIVQYTSKPKSSIIINIPNTIPTIPVAPDPTIVPIKPTPIPKKRISEFVAYKINNTLDLYTKGKLQGFFQIQYFGLIFTLFTLTLICFFKKIWSIFPTKQILIFLGLYYIFFIDIFNLNKHRYAEVLSISHKYTSLLIPFIGILIATQWDLLQKIFIKINHSFFRFIFILLTLIGLLSFFKSFWVLYFLQFIVPIHSTTDHYLMVIKLAGIGLSIFSLLFLISEPFILKYSKLDYRPIIILFTIFFLPFLLFFHTNFGLDNTLLYSFSSKSTKLAHIPGWESLYDVVNLLNQFPPTTRYLFINGNINQLAIHFRFPASNIYKLNKNLNPDTASQEISDTVNKYRINYLLIGPQSSIPINYRLVFSTDSFLIYQTPFTN